MLNDATPAFLEALSARLPPGMLGDVPSHYLVEPRGRHSGRAAALARPAITEEVAMIVKACAEARVGIVPYGGGTGLVAGQTALADPAPLLLSLERMSRIRGVLAEEDVIEAEAGATLSAIQEAAAANGRLFPLSYGSEGTAQIGAALSVNSGGTGVLRYGSARDLCLGIEAVLADGSVFRGLKRLRKDNTGYDVRNLLIGSEGTLGVITAASLRLFPRPARKGAALFCVPTPAAALTLLGQVRERVGQGISGFELMSGVGLRFLRETGQVALWPGEDIPAWAVLVDLGLTVSEDPDLVLQDIFEAAAEAGLASDGILAQTCSQRAAFWAVRDAIPLANRAIGAVASHDISVPLGEIDRFLTEVTPEIEAIAALRVNAFGHLGDGNLHYNVFPARGRDRAEFEAVRATISEIVHSEVVARGGSFSAEHGIGRLKVTELERYADPTKLAVMRAIKAALDPTGIMNPGAVLRYPANE